MVDLIVSRGADRYIIESWDIDLAYGTYEGENDFCLTPHKDLLIAEDSLIRVDGSDIGGIVDERTTKKETSTGGAVSYKGRTWSGMLANKILSPDPGQDHLRVSGPTTQVLRSLIDRVGLGDVFVVDPCPGSVSYRFERYTDAYKGITKMLASSGLRLRFESRQDQTYLSAAAIVDNSDVIDSDLIDFTSTKTYRRVNHLIGMGEGELRNRVIVHYYANAKGEVSKQQTLFGVDEITQTYDYSNAKAEELDEKTRDKLKELQGEGSVEVTVLDGTSYEVGDLVTGRDNRTGVTVKAPIVKKIIKAEHGLVSVEYQAGNDGRREAGGLTGSAESGSPSSIIQAGNGLTMVGNTLNADVNAADLQAVRKKADAAEKTASHYEEQIGQAQAAARASVHTIVSEAPLTASRNGGDVSLSVEAATPSGAGMMSAADKGKLDGIEDGANNYRLPPATSETLGGVRPDGTSITISADGILSTHATTDNTAVGYPVGSVITNTTGDDPADVYGGTWHRLPSLGAFTWERTL